MGDGISGSLGLMEMGWVNNEICRRCDLQEIGKLRDRIW